MQLAFFSFKDSLKIKNLDEDFSQLFADDKFFLDNDFI